MQQKETGRGGVEKKEEKKDKGGQEGWEGLGVKISRSVSCSVWLTDRIDTE